MFTKLKVYHPSKFDRFETSIERYCESGPRPMTALVSKHAEDEGGGL